MRPTTEQNAQAIREMREAWTWVQPANTAELLARLAQGRDITMPRRELENLCAAAISEINKLLSLLTEREDILQEFVDDAAYVRDSRVGDVSVCVQCDGVKANRHKDGCVVGKAEALLRHMEA